jgi:hypothetical protein
MEESLGTQDGKFYGHLLTQHDLSVLTCVYSRMSQWELEILTYVRIQTHHIRILIRLSLSYRIFETHGHGSTPYTASGLLGGFCCTNECYFSLECWARM